jgi:outer membrane lipoprotein LolB
MVWPLARLRLAVRRTAPAAALAVALVTGCTSLAPMPAADRTYAGRFAATATAGNQQDNASGRFTLAVRADGVTLDLASPLGNTLARVHTGGGSATLMAPQTDGSLATWDGDSAEALAEQALGWAMPVSGMADWIDGRAVPSRPAQVAPASGPAQRIEQDGWRIEIDERFESSGAPRRLTLERAGTASTPAVRLRLVLDEPESRGARGPLSSP